MIIIICLLIYYLLLHPLIPLHWLGRVLNIRNGLKMSQDNPLSSHWPTTINSLSNINNGPLNVINHVDQHLEVDVIYVFMTKQTKTITHTQESTAVTLTLITNRRTNNQNKDSVGIQICNLIIRIIHSGCCNGKCTNYNWCEESRIEGEQASWNKEWMDNNG